MLGTCFSSYYVEVLVESNFRLMNYKAMDSERSYIILFLWFEITHLFISSGTSEKVLQGNTICPLWVIYILKHLEFKNLHLIHKSFLTFSSLVSTHKTTEGFCLPGIRKTSVAANKLAPSKAVEVPKATLQSMLERKWSGLLSHIMLEQTFLSRYVESSWGRIWVWAPNRWSHNTM